MEIENINFKLFCGALSTGMGINGVAAFSMYYLNDEPLLSLISSVIASTALPLGLYLVGTGIAEEISEKMIEKMGNPVYPVSALAEKGELDARFSGTDLSPVSAGFSGSEIYASESGKDESYLTAYS